MGGGDLVGVAVEHPHLSAQGAEDVQADGYVADVGQILDHTDAGRQDGGGQDAHRRIFGARNSDFALQGLAAGNYKLLQSNDLLHGSADSINVPRRTRSLHLDRIFVHNQADFQGSANTPFPLRLTLLYTTPGKKQSFRPEVCSYFLFCPDSPYSFVFFLSFTQNTHISSGRQEAVTTPGPGPRPP